MNEEIVKLLEDKTEDLYNSCMDRPLKVLSIFNDFFGEDRIDMQGYPSLEEFKVWIHSTPIDRVFEREISGMSDEEWKEYHRCPISGLSEYLIDSILNTFRYNIVKERVGWAVFGNMFILVHFPHVRITNEHNRFVDINHLWAKVKVMYNGTLSGSFTLNRSEYTLLHISSNYMHSHISDIPKSNFEVFKSPCTGSGPINGTISTLNREYDEDMWNMFCLELSKYVTVESIAGRPYKYLEKLGTGNMISEGDFTTYLTPGYYNQVVKQEKLKEFVRHFINLKKLKFNYVKGSYSIGMSFVEFMILISNEFIKWYNDHFNKTTLTVGVEELIRRGLLRRCIIDKGRVYYDNHINNPLDYLQYIGKKVCTFKGKDITINITDIAETKEENKSIILNTQTALYILTTILKVLNYRYGRSETTCEDNQSGTEIWYL